jgi:nucleoid-associated protein EbfC
MNMFDMLRQAHTMKEKMKTLEEDLERQTFSASAGDGAVSIVINGKLEVQKVSLDPRILQSGDAPKIQEWIQKAVNEAGRQAKEKLKSEASKLTGGLDISGLF